MADTGKDSTLPSPSPSTPEHPSVRPVACLRCRKRRSYCSKEKPTCERCRDGPFNCIYEEARKIIVNETYLRRLEAKVKAYEVTITATTPCDDDYEDDDDYEQLEDDHVLLGPFTQLSIDKPSTSFKGPGSSDFFVLKVREVSGVPSYGDGDDGLDLNPNFYDPGALPSRRRLAARTHIRLPPIDIARRLFAAYYTYIGTIFGFTDPSTFDSDLAAAYRAGQPDLADKTACLKFAKLLTILAFGQLYSVNQWIDFKGPPGFEYFTHALLLLPDAHEEGSILCAETLALVGYFMQNLNRRDAAFLYMGMALRMAISLGLHQEVTSTSPLDASAREHRRRVWWSIYSLDRILTVKSGNPITIHDEDIGVHSPSALPHDPPYCPALVLRHYTELSRILGTITQAIYRRSSTPQSGRRLMAAVQAIVLALSRWRTNLPDELRFGPEKLSISRESVSTFSHYYQCINMTARPLLFHVVQQRLRGKDKDKEKPWKNGLDTSTIRVIDMCILAAQDTVNMMTIAKQRDLVATYGYMDGEHVFSAAIVLVMVCVAFPASEANTAAMNAGLELLRGMAERGNSHMAARYELLVRLRSAVPTGDGFGGGEMGMFDFSMWAQQQQEEGEGEREGELLGGGFSPWLDPGLWTPEQAAMLGMQFADAVPTALDGPARGINTMNMGTNLAAAAAIAGSGGGTGLDLGATVGGNGLVFPMVDHRQLGEPFYDETMSNGGDFMLWEQGFANPTVDVGYDLTHNMHLANAGGQAGTREEGGGWAAQ
ncbi:fungal-specific transcription factor [Cercophora scortea]|uniref:Fungal-specific transcription factor n=1 Tax=Cercophora scortea TaxID=314031 RepID=A0AAE0M6L4_9PEZI|nr:fungal-specific transcription factor [Cercophora scortea]